MGCVTKKKVSSRALDHPHQSQHKLLGAWHDLFLPHSLSSDHPSDQETQARTDPQRRHTAASTLEDRGPTQMEIHKEDFVASLPMLQKAIAECDFVAMDTELTGKPLL
jgi:hypothetical protein